MVKNIYLLLLLLSRPLLGQDFHEISLNSVDIETDGFKIVEVLDGRTSKNNIGWVQTGMFNKRKIAVFQKPFTEALDVLIEQSRPKQDIPITIRVNLLHVSEQTTAMSETARAQLALDFFLAGGTNEYYFIASTYSSVESGGVDVTRAHPANIESVLSKGIEQFAQREWRMRIDSTNLYTRKELIDGVRDKTDLSSFVILKTKDFRAGIYTCFDDFLNNDPSITDNYRVKNGGKKVKLWLIEDGAKKRVKEGVYGFAYNNQLFVLFQEGFYPLQRKNDTFYFTGPHIPNLETVGSVALMAGVIGGVIAAAASGGSYTYTIDLNSGSILIR